MIYLLNSAVLAAGAYGTYRFSAATPDDLARFVALVPVSRIGYAETLDYIYRVTGVRLPLSRELILMAPGDEAMVVRLRYRVDHASKGAPQHPADEDWEIAYLTRLS